MRYSDWYRFNLPEKETDNVDIDVLNENAEKTDKLFREIQTKKATQIHTEFEITEEPTDWIEMFSAEVTPTNEMYGGTALFEIRQVRNSGLFPPVSGVIKITDWFGDAEPLIRFFARKRLFDGDVIKIVKNAEKITCYLKPSLTGKGSLFKISITKLSDSDEHITWTLPKEMRYISAGDMGVGYGTNVAYLTEDDDGVRISKSGVYTGDGTILRVIDTEKRPIYCVISSFDTSEMWIALSDVAFGSTPTMHCTESGCEYVTNGMAIKDNGVQVNMQNTEGKRYKYFILY